MELEEWEYLSDDGIIDDLHHPNSLIDSEYLQKFIDPKLESKGVSISPSLVIPVPVEFDLSIPEPPKDSAVKEVAPFQAFGSELDQESVSSQVFFKKLKGSMRLDSPKSKSRGIAPQFDLGKSQFEEKDEGFRSDEPCSFDFDENNQDPDQKECEDDENHGGLNIWKMGMTGIGAVCSFGLACAAIFVVIALGARRREEQLDQTLNFQVYAGEKRMEQFHQQLGEFL